MSDRDQIEQRTRRREFRITVGLREGYRHDAPVHSADEVTQIAADWMVERLATGEPVISGMVTSGEVIYAGHAPDGGLRLGREPVAMVTGEVIATDLASFLDSAIEAQLNALAKRLGEELVQEHVTVAYRDESWVVRIDQGGRVI
jgi:hypothetical protein